MVTKQIVLASRPEGMLVEDNFRQEVVKLGPLQEGEVLLKGMYYSVDPYMRGRMNEVKSYVAPYQIGQAIEGGVIASVTESQSPSLKTGDIIVGSLPWRQEIITVEKGLRKIDTTLAPPSYYLGLLGMTGLTAYFGLTFIGKPKEGETVVISGAAGAVGIVVGQIAKIQGCHVVGIAGSDEKIKLLKEELGFNEAINYKTTIDLKKAIAAACPRGVDVYFDNVGGEISDAVIANINFHARIPLCGQISFYNSTSIPIGPRIQPMLLTRSALMQGFIVTNFQNDFGKGIKQLAAWVQEGKLKFMQTIIHGFDHLPVALIGLLRGDNTGKMLVEA